MSHKERLLRWLFSWRSLNRLWHLIAPKGALILTYHGVCADDFYLLDGYDERHVRQSEFLWQIDYLKNIGYCFVSISEILQAIQTGESEVTPLATVTFDDGFENVLKNALPIMTRLEVKGCMYVKVSDAKSRPYVWTDIVEVAFWAHQGSKLNFSLGGQPITFYLHDRQDVIKAILSVKKYLRSIKNSERINEMLQFENIFDKLPPHVIPKEFRLCQLSDLRFVDREVLAIGSHTITHPNLDRANDREIDYEVLHSKEILETELGYKIEHFCYPGGAFDRRVKKHVIEAGYQSAVTQKLGRNKHNTDLYELRRVGSTNNRELFIANIAGIVERYQTLLNLLKH